MTKRPRNEDIGREEFDNTMHPVSGTECTGLEQTPPMNDEEARSYTDIYDIPLSKQERVPQHPPTGDAMQGVEDGVENVPDVRPHRPL